MRKILRKDDCTGRNVSRVKPVRRVRKRGKVKSSPDGGNKRDLL